MSNTVPDNMLLLMDSDALRAKFFRHADKGSSMTFSSFAIALDDLDIRKDQSEIDEIRQRYDLKNNGRIGEKDFLAAIHSKSKMEHMLDGLPIIRTLSNCLSSQTSTTSKMDHFINMSDEEITQSLNKAIQIIRAILLKQQQLLSSVSKKIVPQEAQHNLPGKTDVSAQDGNTSALNPGEMDVGAGADLAGGIAKDGRGHTPLRSRAKDSSWLKTESHTKIAKPSSDVKDENGHTALHHAVVNQRLSLIQTLCTKGANVNCQDNEGWTPLMVAAGTGQLKVVKYLLLQAKADVHVKTKSGESAVLFACQSGHLNVVKFLAEQSKLDVLSVTDDARQTPLHFCAGAGRLDVVRYLVEHQGVSVDVADSTGCTPLMHACVKAHLDVAKWLSNEAGANKSYQFVEGTTALMLASEMGHLEVVEWLLVESALNIDGVNSEGINALMYACDGGHLDVAEHLVLKSANPKAASKLGGVTPLICASDEGHLEVVRFLVNDCKVNVEAKESEDGMTALLGAVQNGHHETVAFLVKDAKANVNVQTRIEQYSALHLAAENGDQYLVAFLIEEGKADLSLTTRKGETALSLAERAGHEDIIEFLRTTSKEETIEPSQEHSDALSPTRALTSQPHTTEKDDTSEPSEMLSVASSIAITSPPNPTSSKEDTSSEPCETSTVTPSTAFTSHQASATDKENNSSSEETSEIRVTTPSIALTSSKQPHLTAEESNSKPGELRPIAFTLQQPNNNLQSLSNSEIDEPGSKCTANSAPPAHLAPAMQAIDTPSEGAPSEPEILTHNAKE